MLYALAAESHLQEASNRYEQLICTLHVVFIDGTLVSGILISRAYRNVKCRSANAGPPATDAQRLIRFY
jgi:alpha-D-ribose 1-methylphosphonate 5-triphosphate synthase subunit PhnI